MIFSVKLDKWVTPLSLRDVATPEQAKAKALSMFPTCDCCDEPTNVEWVKVSA